MLDQVQRVVRYTAYRRKQAVFDYYGKGFYQSIPLLYQSATEYVYTSAENLANLVAMAIMIMLTLGYACHQPLLRSDTSFLFVTSTILLLQIHATVMRLWIWISNWRRHSGIRFRQLNFLFLVDSQDELSAMCVWSGDVVSSVLEFRFGLCGNHQDSTFLFAEQSLRWMNHDFLHAESVIGRKTAVIEPIRAREIKRSSLLITSKHDRSHLIIRIHRDPSI